MVATPTALALFYYYLQTVITNGPDAPEYGPMTYNTVVQFFDRAPGDMGANVTNYFGLGLGFQDVTPVTSPQTYLTYLWWKNGLTSGTMSYVVRYPSGVIVAQEYDYDLSSSDSSKLENEVNCLADQYAAPSIASVVAGSNQSTLVGSAFTTPLQVLVTSSFDSNPLPGVPVTFTVPAGQPGGTFSNGATTMTVPTGANGVALANFTANLFAGSYTVTASASEVATPVSFSLTNLSPLGNSENAIYVENAYGPPAESGRRSGRSILGWPSQQRCLGLCGRPGHRK